MLRLTASFTWEELPTRDPDTGNLTKAGYIPMIQSLTKYTAGFLISFHIVQTTVRMLFNHEMVLTSWVPFDISEAPVYAFANIVQVQSTA
jgi:hypothetical protein